MITAMNCTTFKGAWKTPFMRTHNNYTEEGFIYDISVSLAITLEIIVQSSGKCERIYPFVRVLEWLLEEIDRFL